MVLCIHEGGSKYGDTVVPIKHGRDLILTEPGVRSSNSIPVAIEKKEKKSYFFQVRIQVMPLFLVNTPDPPSLYLL